MCDDFPIFSNNFFTVNMNKNNENKLGLSWAKLSRAGTIGLIWALLSYCWAKDVFKGCYRSMRSTSTCWLGVRIK